MSDIMWVREIDKEYDEEILSSRVYARVKLRFVPNGGKGLQFEPELLTAMAEEEKFISGVKRGLEAAYNYYSLSGVKAVLTYIRHHGAASFEFSFAWAAALALREAVLADNQDLPREDDAQWLRKVGLRPDDKAVKDTITEMNIYSSHPWAREYMSLREDAPKEKRIAILQAAVDQGDDVARSLLAHLTGDTAELERIAREEALENKNIFYLIDFCQEYEDGKRPADDPEAVQFHIVLGDLYLEWNDTWGPDWADKMKEAYEMAWKYAQRQGTDRAKFMTSFAARVGDTLSQKDGPCYDRQEAEKWYNRAGDTWEIRLKKADLKYNRDEYLYLGDCYYSGTSPTGRDPEMAVRYYAAVKTELGIRAYYRRNEGGAAYGHDPLEIMVEERLGDLYSQKGSSVYDPELAKICYEAVAAGSRTAAEKLKNL